jgi:hypothetical protein
VCAFFIRFFSFVHNLLHFRVGATRVATPSIFAIRAEKIRSLLCGAVYVNTYHVVENDLREEWENFTAKEGTKMADDATAAVAEYDLVDWPITTTVVTLRGMSFLTIMNMTR